MKPSYFFFLILVVIVAGCTTPSSLKDFEALCIENNHTWMRMTPMENGVETSSEACWGCMINNNHVCDQSAYEMMVRDMDSGHATDHMDMEHMMAAHAGQQKSVDIHSSRVTFDRSSFTTGTTTDLSFLIEDISTGQVITDLEIMHDKPMHVVLVRDDLQHFDHIHPTLQDEQWVVSYTFRAGGQYRIWIDFMNDGMMHLVDFDVLVDGDDAEEQEHLGGLQVEMKQDGPDYSFFVYDENKRPIALTERFLGAAAHLVTIDSTLQDFGHTHDEEMDGDHILTFTPTFTKSGMYRGWVQFMYDGKERTAPASFFIGESHEH